MSPLGTPSAVARTRRRRFLSNECRLTTVTPNKGIKQTSVEHIERWQLVLIVEQTAV